MQAFVIQLINDLFCSNCCLVVPLFQRDYVWDKKNWETLWKDVLSYYDDEESAIDCNDEESSVGQHFMGPIVLSYSPSSSVSRYLIIDGQQRLTTLSILLCALRDYSCLEDFDNDEKNHKKFINKLNKTLFNADETGVERFKLLPLEKDRKIYEKLINIDEKKDQQFSDDEKQSQIYACYEYFRTCFKTKKKDGGVNLERIRNILYNFKVVKIDLQKDDDPCLLYESLNFKGMKLTQADLIHNLLLMKCLDQPDLKQEAVYENYWKPWEEYLDDKIEDFFFHYIRMKKRNANKQKLIYSDLKSYLNSSIKDHLEDINKYVLGYDILLHPEKEKNEDVRRELEFLNKTDCKAIYPFLLKLVYLFQHESLTKEVYLRCFHLLSSYVIRKKICQKQTNSLNNTTTKLLSKLYEKEDRTDLDEWLENMLTELPKSAYWPDDEEFKNAIQTKNDISDRIQRLFLEGIEKKLAGKECIDLTDPKKVSLEHIMPQVLTDDWRKALGENYGKIHDEYLNNLGNLTLTGYNQELSNKSFNEKKNMGYAHSGLKMNLEIAQESRWGKEEIERRAERLAEMAVEIWKHPGRTSKEKKDKLVTLDDKWTFRKPAFVWIQEKKTEANTWKRAANIIAEYLYGKYPEQFLEILNEKKFSYDFSGKSKYPVELCSSAEDIRYYISQWLKACNVDKNIFQFELQ